MNIVQDFIPAGRKNRPGYVMKPEYITVHDTANPARGADALAHATYLKGNEAAARPVSWHFTVDDKRVVQHLPITESAWHAGDGGSGTGNRKSIGIEICENSDCDRAKAEDNAAWLVAHLIEQHDLTLDRVVQHNHWSGKNCPRIIRARKNGWQEFLEKVESYMGNKELEQKVDQLTKQVEALSKSVADLRKKGLDKLDKINARIERLEHLQNMPEIPGWASEAVEAAVRAGLIDTPDGGSYDFYRTITVLYRKGLI